MGTLKYLEVASFKKNENVSGSEDCCFGGGGILALFRVGIQMLTGPWGSCMDGVHLAKEIWCIPAHYSSNIFRFPNYFPAEICQALVGSGLSSGLVVEVTRKLDGPVPRAQFAVQKAEQNFLGAAAKLSRGVRSVTL